MRNFQDTFKTIIYQCFFNLRKCKFKLLSAKLLKDLTDAFKNLNRHNEDLMSFRDYVCQFQTNNFPSKKQSATAITVRSKIKKKDFWRMV